jgi:hypothetical protein
MKRSGIYIYLLWYAYLKWLHWSDTCREQILINLKVVKQESVSSSTQLFQYIDIVNSGSQQTIAVGKKTNFIFQLYIFIYHAMQATVFSMISIVQSWMIDYVGYFWYI